MQSQISMATIFNKMSSVFAVRDFASLLSFKIRGLVFNIIFLLSTSERDKPSIFLFSECLVNSGKSFLEVTSCKLKKAVTFTYGYIIPDTTSMVRLSEVKFGGSFMVERLCSELSWSKRQGLLSTWL